MSSYRFGPFLLDVQERRLVRDGTPIPLTPKMFDTLVYLVERNGRLVGKAEVLGAIWGGSHVEEGSLPRAIHILRKALIGENGQNDLHGDGQYIETVPTKGYRFTAAVTRLDATPAPPDSLAAEMSAEPERRQHGGRASRRSELAAACALIIVVLAATAWGVLGQRGAAALPALRRATSPTSSGAAYAKFQSGRFRVDRHLPGDIETSLDDFETAIRLDPGFAAAYAGKADARMFRYWDTGAHDDIAQARVAIRKAIEMDPESSYAHAVQCRLLGSYDWDFVGAEAECRRAVELDPHNHTARGELAFVISTRGRRDEGLEEMDAAIALAPTSFNKRSRGLLLYFHRLFDAGIVQLKQVEATDPEYVESSRWIARCFEQKHDYERALQFLIRHYESGGARPEKIASLRRAFASGGWPAVLRASLPDGPQGPTLEAAGTLAQLGEIDAAFETLESMISARRVMIVHMDAEPRLDPLRSDRRFAQLVRRVGLRRP